MPLFDAPVLLLGVDIIIGLLAHPYRQIIHVLARKSIVLIKYLAQILHLAATHLEDGIKHGVIDCIVKPPAAAILQIVLLDQEEEIDPAGAKVAVEMGFLAVLVVLFDLLWVGIGDADFEDYLSFGLDVVAIDCHRFAAMVLRIDNLKHIPAD